MVFCKLGYRNVFSVTGQDGARHVAFIFDLNILAKRDALNSNTKLEQTNK